MAYTIQYYAVELKIQAKRKSQKQNLNFRVRTALYKLILIENNYKQSTHLIRQKKNYWHFLNPWKSLILAKYLNYVNYIITID